jgi:hypothetical protein
MTTAHRKAIAEAKQRLRDERRNATIPLTGTYTLEEQALRGVARRLTDKSLRARLSGDTLLTLADRIAEVQTVVVEELRRVGDV